MSMNKYSKYGKLLPYILYWLMPLFEKYNIEYNSFYKCYIGSLVHDDLYEMVIANVSCWGILDSFKILLFFLLRNYFI